MELIRKNLARILFMLFKLQGPIFSSHPWLYTLRVWQRRLTRNLTWLFSRRICSQELLPNQPLYYRCIKHTSKLIRTLGDSDIRLQHNKVVNLKIAVQYINGIIIRPGEYFSFCRLVGNPTKERGFIEGMQLSRGQAISGIGGGLCQLSNLIHWIALHSPLRVVERSNHSFDPFPDNNRVLPFGSGAAIFYNFVDLVLHNPTNDTYQILCKVGEHQLEGELRCDAPTDVKFHVYEKNHAFIRENGIIYRHNELWRDMISKGHNPKILRSELLYANKAVVKYHVDESALHS